MGASERLWSPVSGRLTVVGLGPGRPDWCLPEVADRLRTATDLVGYGPYLDLIGVPTVGVRHPSDNRVEADRSRHALDLAVAGGDVVVVSSGDPGIFAMASAIMEQLDADRDRWSDVEVEILPGITAAQSVASRVGAPLGHDFCVISLSDVLKPWAVIEQRLVAVAGADFVIALYNPVSRHRPWQLARAIEIIRTSRAPLTPVILGRNVGRSNESVVVVAIADLDPSTIDMSTVLVVGSSTTVVIPGRPLASSVYTPRTYP